MRKDFVIGIFATVFAMTAFYLYDHSDQKKSVADPSSNEISMDDIQKQSTVQVTEPISSDGTVAQIKAIGTAASEPAKPEDNEQVYKNFSEHLRAIGTCLEIKNAVDSESIDPTFDNLVVSLRPAFGEIVVQMDDWTQRELRNAQGDRKRIRTEVNYQDGGLSTPTKRVQLYKVNDQGMPELQNIDPEQSVNPTEAYIDSLKTGFETSSEEKGGRAYYQEGEEIVMIERNGKLESISISRNGKTTSCTGLDSLKSSCQCL